MTDPGDDPNFLAWLEGADVASNASFSAWTDLPRPRSTDDLGSADPAETMLAQLRARIAAGDLPPATGPRLVRQRPASGHGVEPELPALPDHESVDELELIARSPTRRFPRAVLYQVAAAVAVIMVIGSFITVSSLRHSPGSEHFGGSPGTATFVDRLNQFCRQVATKDALAQNLNNAVTFSAKPGDLDRISQDLRAPVDLAGASAAQAAAARGGLAKMQQAANDVEAAKTAAAQSDLTATATAVRMADEALSAGMQSLTSAGGNDCKSVLP